MNLTLPVLPVWQARSFYAQLLLFAAVMLNLAGIDLFAVLGQIGAGSTPEEVLTTGDRVISAWQQVAPLAFGLWAWVERRAPNYRLGLSVPATFLPVLAAVLAVGLVLGAGRARAEPLCAGYADLLAGLYIAHGEVPVWSGLAATGELMEVVANPDGTTWTALSVKPGGQACFLTAGDGWAKLSAPAVQAPGEDG
ncbi:hypothetical protein RNZ50_15735 [Paracoccaceae bacterium Fryx2]|nr:hypothetical protein [Paracoccaceae bacterium Fryx2]